MKSYTQLSITEKNKLANKDFNELLSQGNIAFYKGCEVTQIFIYNKSTNEVYNYYTLICFDEIESIDSKSIGLGINNILKNLYIGIQRKRISIKDAQHIFTDVQKGILNYDGLCSMSKDMVLLPKMLVPHLTTNKVVLINSVLKPNYWGDNYIIEFYDQSKDIISNLSFSNEIIDKINSFVSKTIKIDLEKPYDRIGNIIFQFPITILACDIESNKDSVSESIDIKSHPLLYTPKNYFIEMKTELDDLITGYNNSSLASSASTTKLSFLVGDDNNLNIIILDSDRKIVLHYSIVNFIRGFNFGGKLGSQYSEPRTMVFQDGTKEEIELFQSTPFSSVNISKDDYFERIIKRNHNREIIIHSSDCAVFKHNQRNEALSFLRNKINGHNDSIKEICLWDPYLRASDIIETLYFENTGIPFRCITQYQSARKLTNKSVTKTPFTFLLSFFRKSKPFTFTDFCNEENDFFKTHSNNLRVKMKYLAQHGTFGWKFHDRFLIFVPHDITDIPTVYSLGISVNEIGNSHHIVQKVPDPRKILNNFEELWAALDNGQCLVTEF